MISINEKEVNSIFEENQEIGKIYKGTLLVYGGWKNLIASGVPPLTLTKCKGVDLLDYKLYGNSVQNGTPTPDTPIEVESVGERTKNLFNPTKNFNSYNANGITIDYLEDEDCFVINGTSSVVTMYAHRYINIPITKGSYFSLSAIYVSGTITKPKGNELSVMYFGGSDSINAFNNWSAVGLREQNNKRNNVQCNYNYISSFWFFMEAGITFDNYKVKIQLEEGATETEYEPYGYKIPVKVSGKNLLEINRNMPYTQYGLTVSRKSDGAINVKGDVTTIASLYLSSGLNLTLPAGTYTLNNTGIKGIDVYLLPGYTKGTFTLKTPKTYTGVYIDVTSSIIGQNIDFDYYPQLELGSVATDYEPYIEPITTNIYLNEPLRKVGNYYDYIDFASGKVVRNLKEVELDGTGAWVLYPNTTTGYTFYKSFTDSIMEYQSSLSSHFANVNGVWGNKLNGIYSDHYSATIKYFKAPNSDITTVDQFKNWLSSEKTKGTPVKLIYTLAKPTEETIELPNIPTLKGTTIIDIDTNIQSSNLEVTYKGKK